MKLYSAIILVKTQVFVSDNVIYETTDDSIYDIKQAYSISINDSLIGWNSSINTQTIDEFLYNVAIISFSWQRSNKLKIVGNLTKFDFSNNFSVDDETSCESQNENKFIDYRNYTYLYEFVIIKFRLQ